MEIDKKALYEKIYDEMCDYLDNEFKKNNYCDFQNDKCIANRNGASVHDIMGCCYSFDNKMIISNVRVCKHLKDKKCEIKCLTCKLFVCKYLKKKGISYNIDNILGEKYKLNKKEKDILKYNFFKTKEEIISKLLKKDNIPYYLWFLLEKYKIM